MKTRSLQANIYEKESIDKSEKSPVANKLYDSEVYQKYDI